MFVECLSHVEVVKVNSVKFSNIQVNEMRQSDMRYIDAVGNKIRDLDERQKEEMIFKDAKRK